jgi:hypothetical protein
MRHRRLHDDPYSFVVMEITRSETGDYTTWTLAVDGVAVSCLRVWADTGEIESVQTEARHLREGYARLLYEHAQAEFSGGIFHSLYEHRTESGKAFVDSVGGDTIDGAVARPMGDCPCEDCERLRGRA